MGFNSAFKGLHFKTHEEIHFIHYGKSFFFLFFKDYESQNIISCYRKQQPTISNRHTFLKRLKLKEEHRLTGSAKLQRGTN